MDSRSQLRFVRMRVVATVALGLVFSGAIGFRILEAQNPAFGYLRAFCEAATVGGLADWFAVVALFRHPMGIPIPHTAILPRNKDRVAESLATFIETNFLAGHELSSRLQAIDYSGFVGRWLEENAGFLAREAGEALPRWLDGMEEREMAAFFAAQLREMLLRLESAPLASTGLSALMEDGRDRELFSLMLRSCARYLEENREMIRSRIREEIPLSPDLLRQIPGLGELAGTLVDQLRDQLAGAVAGRTIEKVRTVLSEAGEDLRHPLWLSFDTRLRRFISDLQNSPGMAARINELQARLAGSEMVSGFSLKATRELKAFLHRDSAAEHSVFRQHVESTLQSLGRLLREDEPIRTAANRFLAGQVLSQLQSLRPHARELVLETVRNWDGDGMAKRLEGIVGSDLQFIRLNGTLVGGLIGLLLFVAFQAFGL